MKKINLKILKAALLIITNTSALLAASSDEKLCVSSASTSTTSTEAVAFIENDPAVLRMLWDISEKISTVDKELDNMIEFFSRKLKSFPMIVNSKVKNEAGFRLLCNALGISMSGSLYPKAEQLVHNEYIRPDLEFSSCIIWLLPSENAARKLAATDSNPYELALAEEMASIEDRKKMTLSLMTTIRTTRDNNVNWVAFNDVRRKLSFIGEDEHQSEIIGILRDIAFKDVNYSDVLRDIANFNDFFTNKHPLQALYAKIYDQIIAAIEMAYVHENYHHEAVGALTNLTQRLLKDAQDAKINNESDKAMILCKASLHSIKAIQNIKKIQKLILRSGEYTYCDLPGELELATNVLTVLMDERMRGWIANEKILVIQEIRNKLAAGDIPANAEMENLMSIIFQEANMQELQQEALFGNVESKKEMISALTIKDIKKIFDGFDREIQKSGLLHSIQGGGAVVL